MKEANTLHHAACACESFGSAFRATATDAETLGKIDWTRVKLLVASLIENFGPILINALIGKLVEPNPEATPDEPAAT